MSRSAPATSWAGCDSSRPRRRRRSARCALMLRFVGGFRREDSMTNGSIQGTVTRNELTRLLAYAKAIRDAMLESAKGDALWRFSSYRLYLRKYNELVEEVAAIIGRTGLGTYDLAQVPARGDTFAAQQKEYFDSAFVEVGILVALLENKLEVNEDEGA